MFGDLNVLGTLGAVNLTQGYDSLIFNASNKYGVDANLIKAFIQTESSWNPNAVRQEPQINDASIGLMQILLKTAQWLTNNPNLASADLYNAGTNIDIGTKYIAKQLSRYSGDIPKAIAAYNAGSAKYKLNGDFINQNYVDTVMGYYQEYVTDNQPVQDTSTVDNSLPVPIIPMVDSTPTSVDTTVADTATADVSAMPTDVASNESVAATPDNPTDVSLPFNPITGLIVVGGFILFGGGIFGYNKYRS